MFLLFILWRLAASQRENVLDLRPWSPELRAICGKQPVEPPEARKCEDDIDYAKCQIARRISAIDTCDAAVTDWSLCTLMSQPMKSYCCASSVRSDQCSLPQVRNLQASGIWHGFTKGLAIIHANAANDVCLVAESLWVLARTGLRQVSGMNVPGRMLQEKWPSVDRTMHNKLVIPSQSYKEMNSDKRFVTQFGASEPFFFDDKMSSSAHQQHGLRRNASVYAPRRPSDKRYLSHAAQQQAAVPFCTSPDQSTNVLNDLESLANAFFSGKLTADLFVDSISSFMERHFILLNGTITPSSPSLSSPPVQTPLISFFPACSPHAAHLQPYDLRMLEIDIPAAMRGLADFAAGIRDRLNNCNDCVARFWAQMVKLGEQDTSPVDPDADGALLAEGRAIQAALNGFVQGMSDLVAPLAGDESIPQTLHHMVAAYLQLARVSGDAATATPSTAAELLILVADAISTEFGQGPAKGQFAVLLRHFLAEAFNCVGIRRQLQYGGGLGNLMAAAVESPPSPPIIEPLAGPGCTDDVNKFVTEYMQPALDRMNCASLIREFGCQVQNGTAAGLLLRERELVQACPATWLSLCRSEVSPSSFLSKMRALGVEEDETIMGQVSPIESEWTFDNMQELLSLNSQLSEPTIISAYEPLMTCLDQVLRNVQQQETFSDDQKILPNVFESLTASKLMGDSPPDKGDKADSNLSGGLWFGTMVALGSLGVGLRDFA